MCSLISLSQAKHKDFKVSIDNDHSKPTTVLVRLEHRPSIKVKMIGIETKDDLYVAVERMNIWTLLKIPGGRKVIKSKWVYDPGLSGQRNTLHHKVKLVVKRYLQVEDVHFSEVCHNKIYALSISSIRTVSWACGCQGRLLRRGPKRKHFFRTFRGPWKGRIWWLRLAFKQSSLRSKAGV